MFMSNYMSIRHMSVLDMTYYVKKMFPITPQKKNTIPHISHIPPYIQQHIIPDNTFYVKIMYPNLPISTKQPTIKNKK